MRPTVEVEVVCPSWRTSHTSLSLPQRGYCRRSCRTASTSWADQAGLHTRCGREERSPLVPNSRGSENRSAHQAGLRRLPRAGESGRCNEPGAACRGGQLRGSRHDASTVGCLPGAVRHGWNCALGGTGHHHSEAGLGARPRPPRTPRRGTRCCPTQQPVACGRHQVGPSGPEVGGAGVDTRRGLVARSAEMLSILSPSMSDA